MSIKNNNPLCDPKTLSLFGHDVSRLLNYLHFEAFTGNVESKKQQGKANSRLVHSEDFTGKKFSQFFSFKPITLAVAESLFLMSVAGVSFAGYNLNLALPSTDSTGAVIFQNFNDTVDGTHGQTLYYLTGSDNKSLVVTFDKTYPIFQAWDASYDNQFYIAGGIRTLPGGVGLAAAQKLNYYNALGGKVSKAGDLEYVTYNGTDYYLTTSGESGGTALSQSASDFEVTVNIKPGATGTLKIYGGRNDLFTLQTGEENKYKAVSDSGSSNRNTVRVKFDEEGSNEQSIIMTRIIFGGRSAQLETILAESGCATDFNKVYVEGKALKGNVGSDWVFNSDKSTSAPELVSRAGIWGAEGYQTNFNYVNVSNTIVTGATDEARKFGIIGGRGFFSYRINLSEGMPQSGISDNNIAVVTNSAIGLSNPYPTSDRGKVNGQSFSVIGGYSPGEAKDNIAILRDVQINGNVYGGFELQNKLKPGKKIITGPDGNQIEVPDFRDLSPNLVSLRNVKVLEGGAIYGTATGEAREPTAEDVAAGRITIPDLSKLIKENGKEQVFYYEKGVQAVNRYRGAVDIAEKVEADSVYARYVQFGQYIKEDIAAQTKVEVASNYFPHLRKESTQAAIEERIALDKESALELNTVHLGFGDAGYIGLGQQVAGSYLISRAGFHSDLSSKSDNESTITNGMHNFWVGSFVNTVDEVNGDGTSFKTKVNLFKDGSDSVNHLYGENGDEVLSLLTHDDGMAYEYDAASQEAKHNPSLMHHFRYHYKGLVLYTGVSQGTSSPAVQISFDEIAKFRAQQSQDTNAFGNTFVGIIKDGYVYMQGSVTDGQTTVDPAAMTIDVPYSIYQSNEKVANAIYSFYKYQHFDGSDDNFTAGEKTVNGKVTDANTAGGIGLKYWLKELNILPGKNLVLNGVKSGDDLQVEKFQSKDESKRKQELYTLSAIISGDGNIAIAKDSSVVIGSPNTIYTIDAVTELDGVYKVEYKAPQPNEYTGQTLVRSGATLILGKDGALGSKDSYTSRLALDENSNSFLQKHIQTVGSLVVSETGKLNFSDSAEEALATIDKDYKANLGSTGGELSVIKGGADIRGNLVGNDLSKLSIEEGSAVISSANEKFLGTFELRRAGGYLYNSNALQKAKAVVSQGSSLYFHNAEALERTRSTDPRSNAYIGAIQNAGDVFLSGDKEEVAALNHVNVEHGYAGQKGSVLHYRGLVQGPNNSYVDVVHSETATGTSKVSFGDDHSKLPVSGIFTEARGEKTIKSEGIPVFVIKDKGEVGKQLELEMEPFGVVAKDDEAYKWIYNLGYNDDEDGGRTWVLYNSNGTEDNYQLIEEVLRPEAGAYVGASQSWGRMHMRLHDRFGQAYYIDPFDGEEKPAAAWVRQVGSHSHFRMGGGQSKTHSNTAVTQIGGDLLRNEFNEDWKYIGGVFAGGLYNRSDSRSWDSAKSRSDGYSLGIYGTVYTGNSPDDGFYVDSWLLFGRYDNKIWSDEISSFKFKSHGWVWSVETGYTIPLDESGTKDYNKLIWTFQPEAQLVWDGVKAKSAKDPTGTKYRQLGTDNVTLRVGARLHANYMNKGLGFIEGNWIHNTKKAGVQMGTDKVYMDGGRNLGEFRMGLEGHLSRNTLGWATVGVQAGKSGYHNETAQIGIKYMF